jgi:hypothetical protein
MMFRTLTCLALAAGLAACSSTSSATGPRGESLTLVKPADQTVRRGETNKVSVWVRRDKFDAPIELTVDNLPRGLEVVERTARVEPGYDSTEFTLYAKPDADLVAGHAVRVTASAGGDMKAVEWFHVAVKPQ